jgi:hypothetical protein
MTMNYIGRKTIACTLVLSVLFCIFYLPATAYDTKDYLEYNQVLDENGN